MVVNIIIGGLFFAAIAYGAYKSYKSIKSNSCPGCSGGCADQSQCSSNK